MLFRSPKNGGEFVFVWIAVDRNRNEIVDFEVGDRSQDTYKKMEDRIRKKYSVKKLCTDKKALKKNKKSQKNTMKQKRKHPLLNQKIPLFVIILRDLIEKLKDIANRSR